MNHADLVFFFNISIGNDMIQSAIREVIALYIADKSMARAPRVLVNIHVLCKILRKLTPNSNHRAHPKERVSKLYVPFTSLSSHNRAKWRSPRIYYLENFQLFYR